MSRALIGCGNISSMCVSGLRNLLKKDGEKMFRTHLYIYICAPTLSQYNIYIFIHIIIPSVLEFFLFCINIVTDIWRIDFLGISHLIKCKVVL